MRDVSSDEEVCRIVWIEVVAASELLIGWIPNSFGFSLRRFGLGLCHDEVRRIGGRSLGITCGGVEDLFNNKLLTLSSFFLSLPFPIDLEHERFQFPKLNIFNPTIWIDWFHWRLLP